MASRYEILASLMDGSNVTDELGLIESIKNTLHTMHDFEPLMKDDAERAAFDLIFESLAEGWVTVDWGQRDDA